MKENIAQVIRGGGIGVLPTDTLYGLVGSAMNAKTVERIYRVRKRNPKKPMIILIGSERDLETFGVKPTGEQRKLLKKIWPGPVSVIFPCAARRFRYLSRGIGTLAFRLPAKPALRRLLKQTGPIVAPSANPEGREPAETIQKARRYFGGAVDCYSDGGMLRGIPSTVIEMRR